VEAPRHDERNKAQVTIGKKGFQAGAENPSFKHGHGGKQLGLSSEYVIWQGMVQRCTDSNSKDYANYGGRGIKVCSAWREFEAFLADMGSRPAGLTLDRIDNDGNYEPGNCRWATRKEQGRNTRVCKVEEVYGERRPHREWCELHGQDPRAVLQRAKRGWPYERALKTPFRSRARG